MNDHATNRAACCAAFGRYGRTASPKRGWSASVRRSWRRGSGPLSGRTCSGQAQCFQTYCDHYPLDVLERALLRRFDRLTVQNRTSVVAPGQVNSSEEADRQKASSRYPKRGVLKSYDLHIKLKYTFHRTPICPRRGHRLPKSTSPACSTAILRSYEASNWAYTSLRTLRARRIGYRGKLRGPWRHY